MKGIFFGKLIVYDAAGGLLERLNYFLKFCF